MERFASVSEALDFAIAEEESAAAFYTELAGKARTADLRNVFEQFAGEENLHKARLKGVKAGGSLEPASPDVCELCVTDYRATREDTPVSTYQGALLLAMQKEKAAYRMYSDFAGLTGDGELRGLFLGLAREEANHKLRFELEYDAFVAPEN